MHIHNGGNVTIESGTFAIEATSRSPHLEWKGGDWREREAYYVTHDLRGTTRRSCLPGIIPWAENRLPPMTMILRFPLLPSSNWDE